MNDYDEMLESLRKVNPKLFADSQALRKKMDEFHQCYEQEEDTNAKSIYLQGRNLLACALGEELIPETEVQTSTEEVVPDPIIPDKAVGIITDSKVGARCMKQALSVITNMKFQTYHNYGELTKDVLAGKLCGVISAHVHNTNAEGIIRHDLKNRPDWDVEKANAFPLPPVVNMESPVLLLEILKMMIEMHQGNFLDKPQEDEFVLEDHLGELRNTMLVPDSEIDVVIVDDSFQEAEGIVRLLGVWPNIIFDHSLIGPLPRAQAMHFVTSILDGRIPHILLLDEAIGPVKGIDVANGLLKEGYKGILASITGGPCPSFTKHHFGYKTTIWTNREAVEGFIRFMNRLIMQVNP